MDAPDPDRDVGIHAVAIADGPVVFGPRDPKCRIVPPNAVRMLGRVKLRDLVENFGVVLQSLEPVGQSGRERTVPSGCQRSGPRRNAPRRSATRGRRSMMTSYIDPRVHLTSFVSAKGAALVVHAAQGPLALVERGKCIERCASPAPAPRARAGTMCGQQPSGVGGRLGLEEESARERRGGEDHEYTLTSGIGTTNWPPHAPDVRRAVP